MFANPELTAASAELLRNRAAVAGVAVHAYCFMPDHLHLLLSPSLETSLIDFTRDFKGLAARLAWDHGRKGRLWQPGFYDRFLRSDEDVWRVAKYILENPVRKGLASSAELYPYGCSNLGG